MLLYHPYRMVRVNDVAKIMIFTLKNSQNKCHLQLKEFAKMKVKLVLDKSDFLIIFFFLIPQAAGKYRQQGRNYIVDDGDIIFFKFNAGAGLKETKKK